MDDVIRTQRLLLRRAQLQDAAAMHRLMRDAVAMRYWSSPPHDRLEQTEAWMASMVNAPPDQSDDFIVTFDNSLIGKLGAWRLPEIGFLLDRAVWGRGFATEALAAFVERRRRLGSSELTADVDPRNAPSLRLLGRAGFRETGRAARTWNIDGVWHDSVYLRLDL